MQEESLVVRCSLVIAFVLRAAQSLRVFGAGKVSTFEKNRLNFRPGPAQLSTPECEAKFHSFIFTLRFLRMARRRFTNSDFDESLMSARLYFAFSCEDLSSPESTFVKSLVGVGGFPLSAIFSCGII